MKTIRTIGMTVLSVLLLVGVAISGVTILPAGHADLVASSQDVAASAEIKTLKGMIEGIDQAQRIVIIQSEYPPESRGEMWFLDFSDPDVVKGLSKGDRVVVELDDHNRTAKKITKASPNQKDMSTPKN